MQSISNMFNFRPVTSGEYLFKHIASQFLQKESLQQIYQLNHLQVGNRQEDFMEYYIGVYCFNLTTRLIQKAKSVIADAAVNESQRPNHMERYIQTELEVAIHSGNRKEVGQLVSSSITAAIESGKVISNGVKKQVAPNRGTIYCYICGTGLTYNQIQYEHIWPSCYGGDSIADNLLPACADCNNKKGHLLLWQDAHVCSFVLPPTPSAAELGSIQGREKIALHRREIFRTACNSRTSLKEAALKTGAIKQLAHIHQNDAVDFFNCIV